MNAFLQSRAAIVLIIVAGIVAVCCLGSASMVATAVINDHGTPRPTVQPT